MDILASLASPAARTDPYPVLASLRENEPVHHVARADMYLVSGYSEVQQAFRMLGDALRRPAPDELPQQRSTALLAGSVAMKNLPEHTRLRRLVAREFTAGRVEALRERMTKICLRLLDEIAEPLEDHGVVDLCGTVLDRFPVHVISELLGVPAEDTDWLAPHIKTTLAALSPTATEAEVARADEVNVKLEHYFTDLIAERSRTRRDDLVSALVAGGDGDRLTEQEILGTVWAMWLAGFETSASAIGLGVLTMLRHPGPAGGTAYVNEVLRYESPIIFTPLPRIAARPIELGGVVVPEGGRVHFVLAAANRDPAVFTSPDRFDPARDEATHTTFGGGINRCLGAALATMEMSVLLTTLRSRCPGLRLGGGPVFGSTIYMRACHRLPVSL